MLAMNWIVRWAAIAGFLMLFPFLAACQSAGSESVSTAQFPMRETAEGFTVSLESVTQMADQTMISLKVEDADADQGPPMRAYEGLLSVRDLDIQGLSISDDNYAGSTTAIKDDANDEIVAYRHEIPLGPIDEEVAQVTITVNSLRFEAPNPADPPIIVEGDWEFTFNTSDLPTVKLTRVHVGETKQIEDVAFTVESIDIGPTETLVSYVLGANRPGHVEKTNLVAQLADGSFETPIRVENEGDRHIAHFEPFPAGTSVVLIMPSVVVEIQESVSINFPVEGPLDGERTIDHSVSIGGEAARVVSVTNELPEHATDGPAFLVRIENDMPGQDGRVLPGMPLVDQSVRATDNLGNEYVGRRASTNLESADAVTSWAGGSSFTFDGELPAGVTELTISFNNYGKVIGPFTVLTTLPQDAPG